MRNILRPVMLSALMLTLCLIALTSKGQNNSTFKYSKVPNGYLMVLRQGDTVFAQLERFAVAEKIPFAHFTAFGFVNVTFGFFNAATKEFDPKYFENLEMGAVNGSIAWQNGKPSLHVHGAGSDKNFATYGGHILSAIVSTGSLEVFITVTNKRLERIKDEELGANVLEVK